MTDQHGSPRLKARLAGLMWLLSVGFGIFAEMVVRGSLIVRGDPAATASHILAAEPLYRAPPPISARLCSSTTSPAR
jgi:hypothetical protein